MTSVSLHHLEVIVDKILIVGVVPFVNLRFLFLPLHLHYNIGFWEL